MDRIAVITGKMHSGGKKNLIMEYYRHIDKTKIQFDFICDDDSNSIPKEEIEKLGGRVYLVPRYEKIFSNIRAIRKICKKNKYKIVHGYNGTMNVFGMFAAWLAGVPIRINESISMAHKSDKKTILKKLLKPFTKFFSNEFLANGVECGKWQFGKLFEKGKVKIFKTVIDADKNVYDSSIRENCRKELQIENNFVVGHIGRLTAQKNTLFLIDIFNDILKINSNAVLLIIGDGDLREQMLERIARYGIEKQVKYLGRREDIRKFYNAMDCFILPSLYEGLPVVGIESECCGLPIFFSTEIPTESSPCDDLGYFIDINAGSNYWAKMICEATGKRDRKDHSQKIKDNGFDSKMESNKLVEYYEDLLKWKK